MALEAATKTVKVYKSQTVISVAEVEVAGNATDESALKYARAAEGMPNAPEYTEVDRRGTRLSLSEEIGKRETKKKA